MKPWILFFSIGIIFSSSLFAQVSPAWDTTFTRWNNTSVNGNDVPAAMVVDGAGNVYVGGSTQESPDVTDRDWVLLKYDATGNLLWEKKNPTHPGSTNNGDDLLVSMKIDVQGNIYACGRYCFPSSGAGRQANYYVAKFNSDGVVSWSRFYSLKQAGGFDEALAMTLDSAGNVYVTGTAEVGGGNTNITTVKYSSNSSGVDQIDDLWQTSIEGGNGGGNVGKAVNVAANGFVYVGGYSYNGGSGYDFITIQYDPVSGETLWTKKYGGTLQQNDSITGIVSDKSGNVIVSGVARNLQTFNDIQIVKYSSSGALLWSKSYDYFKLPESPAGIAIDKSDNVYVVGVSNRGDSKNDITTIKYNSSTGDTIWTSAYKNLFYNDLASSITIGTDSAVYVAGTIQKDSAGGYKNLVGEKINQYTGVKVWSVELDGRKLDDDATVMAVDAASSFYISGRSLNGQGTYDILTQKYSQGTAIVGRVIDELDGDTSTALDRRPMRNWKVYRYSTSNQLLETTTTDNDGFYNFKNLGSARITFDIICDSAYPFSYLSSPGFGGYSQEVLSSRKIRITVDTANKKGTSVANNFFNLRDPRYSSAIQLDLVEKAIKYKHGKKPKSMPNYANVRDTAWVRTDLKIEGVPKVTGGIILGVRQPLDNITYGWGVVDKKYKNGVSKEAKMYLKFFPKKKNIEDGSFRGSEAKAKALLKYGKKDWAAINGGGYVNKLNYSKHKNHLAGEQMALKINIMASDIGTTPEGFGDLVYYDSTHPTNSFNGLSVAEISYLIDSALTYFDAGFNYDSLDTIATTINKAFNGKVDTLSSDPLRLLGAVRLQNVSFMHKARTSGKQRQKYQQETATFYTPSAYSLEQNFPNPFNPTTTIRFSLAEESFVELKVYNILGQEVQTLLHNDVLDEGMHEFQFDASGFSSGVYFSRLIIRSRENNNKASLQRKMLLLK